MNLSVNDVIHLNGQWENYKLAEQDTTDPLYYGFLASDGRWYILKQSTSGNVTSYRYAKGTSDFSTNWTNRASLSYDYYSNVFPTV